MSAPISILLCALGGEGGSVLAGWLVAACRAAGLPAQATSIPGVAQRTGATTYYLEIYPEPLAVGARKPVLGLNPLPGKLDLLVASELIECARQVANGLPSSDRTMILSNSARVLTTAEKMVMGDGRRDVERLRELIIANSRDRRIVDMTALTAQAGTVMSAVMLGCIAGSGVLPLTPQHYQSALEGDSASAQASRRGFELGLDAASEATKTEWSSVSRSVSRLAEQPVNASVSQLAHEQAARFPDDVRVIAALGVQRMLDYQGAGYATLYIERLQAVLAAERQTQSASHPVTLEVARWLALWMAFDDVIRVAALKSSPERFERVRREVGAAPEDVVRVYDHFKPGLPEFAGMLPERLSRRLLAIDRQRIARGQAPWALALRIGTHSATGLAALRLLAALRFIRPWGSRYQQEQKAISSWLEAVIQGTRENGGLGLELARCGRLIKGYGSTNERGKRNLAHLLEHVTNRDGGSAEARCAAIARVREAALKDEAGCELDEALRAQGAPPRPVEARPVLWMKDPRTRRG